MSVLTNIPDAIKYIVMQMQSEGLDIKYEFGHPKEIQQTLMEKSKDIAARDDRYPLLILFLDFQESVNQDDKNYITVANVTIVIVAETDRNYKAAERLEHSFKAVLWPLYEAFILECEMSPLFDVDSNFRIPHDKMDHYFYSADQAKDQNVFAAYLDAIEITNFELKLQETGCTFEDIVTNDGQIVYHNEEIITHNG